MEALDEALDQDSIDDYLRWDTRDDLAAAIEALRQAARVWDREPIAYAGVVLAIGHDGDVTQTRGVLRQSGEKTIRTIRKGRETAQAARPEGDGQTPDPHADKALTPGFSRRRR